MDISDDVSRDELDGSKGKDPLTVLMTQLQSTDSRESVVAGSGVCGDITAKLEGKWRD